MADQDLAGKAGEHFAVGCNCAQAVLRCFAEQYGLDADTALRLATGFGVGMGRGGACGAVSGAVMVLGLAGGGGGPGGAAAKAAPMPGLGNSTTAFWNAMGRSSAATSWSLIPPPPTAWNRPGARGVLPPGAAALWATPPPLSRP